MGCLVRIFFGRHANRACCDLPAHFAQADQSRHSLHTQYDLEDFKLQTTQVLIRLCLVTGPSQFQYFERQTSQDVAYILYRESNKSPER